MSPPRSGGDYFCELLDFAMPWPDGIAAVLIAHVDASRRLGGTFCVAIVAAGADRAKKATRRWIDLWGNTCCHMTDLNARKKDFRGWTPERAGDHLVESVRVINRFASHVVTASCDIADIERLAPKSADPESEVIRGGLANAYALCCHMAMFALADLVRNKRQGTPDIAYFFEEGDEHQTKSQRFISTAVATPAGPRLYARRSHTVLPARGARMFEMADIVAWEWAKQMERFGEGKSMRPSLKALLGEGISDDTGFVSSTRHMLHMRGPVLERFYRRCESVGMFSDSPTPEQLHTMNEIVKTSSLPDLP